MSVPALKLSVLRAVGGHLSYCDPDQYPVATGSALANARARFPTIRGDQATFEAILAAEHLSPGHRYTPAQLIAINEDYKQMQAIGLRPDGDGYRFDALVFHQGSSTDTWRLSGTVSASGSVHISARTAAAFPNCPICLAAGVGIATPTGPVPVQDIRSGMAVWTTDRRGHTVSAVVLETGHMEAPLGHEVVRLTLADERMVVVSPGHPTSDGRAVGDLEPGDRLDGSVVSSVALIPYAGATWDLRPSGPTGTYFANGVLLGSTLTRTVRAHG